MDRWLDGTVEGKVGEVKKKGFSEKVIFELKSKKEAVMDILQEKLQKKGTASSRGMKGLVCLKASKAGVGWRWTWAMGK